MSTNRSTLRLKADTTYPGAPKGGHYVRSVVRTLDTARLLHVRVATFSDAASSADRSLGLLGVGEAIGIVVGVSGHPARAHLRHGDHGRHHRRDRPADPRPD